MGEDTEQDRSVGAPGWDLSNSALYNEEFGARYWSTLALAHAPYVQFAANLKLFFASLLYRALYLFVCAAGVSMIWTSTLLPENGVWQQVQAGISVGIFTFLLTPLVVTASKAIGVGAHVIVLILFGVALFVASTMTGVVQAYAVNIAGSLILCLALDLSFSRLLRVVAQMRDAARASKAALDDAIDENERETAPQFFAIGGGGTIDETP